jgi:colicin import membrane protein
MNNSIVAPAYVSQETETGKKTTLLMVAASAIGHLIFFLMLIFFPSQIPAKRFSPPAINVTMVSLPALANIPGPVSRAPAARENPADTPKTIAPKPKEQLPPEVHVAQPKETEKTKPSPDVLLASKATPAREPIAPDTISMAPKKKKMKTSLKRKTFRSSQVIKRAIDRIEKKSETSRPKPVTDAIDRMKEQVKGSETVDEAIERLRTKVETDGGNDGQGTGILGRSGIPGKRVLEQIDLYKLEIAYNVEKKWAFSEQLMGGRTDLEAVLVIKIMPNGEIRDIWFEKKSGNSYFDDSAYKAIKKSNPLPPLPKGYRRPFYNVGLVFTPSGLRKGAG